MGLHYLPFNPNPAEHEQIVGKVGLPPEQVKLGEWYPIQFELHPPRLPSSQVSGDKTSPSPHKG